MADDYVNPQANVIEDNDVKQHINQQKTAPKFDFQSASPLKTIPQLSTNRSARYQRPLTDEERGQATADLFTGKPSGMEQERRFGEGVENAGKSAFWGNEAFGNWVPPVVGVMRGIGENKEHPETTGNPVQDVMNSLWDNASRGIFEPSTTEPTSVHVQNNPDVFGKTNPQTAAVWGTLAEYTATMALNPWEAIPEGIQALSKEAQNTLLFNKITQSSHWGDNITAMASKAGTTWDKILPQAQRELWDAIHKGNYFQVVLKNMELYQPFKLKGLTTEDVSIPEEPQDDMLRPTVEVPGKEPVMDINHEKALNQLGMSKDTAVEGKDYKAYFTNLKGEKVTREQSKLPPYNLPNGHSEDISEKKRKLALSSENIVPYEVPQPMNPKTLLAKRVQYLEGQIDSINAQRNKIVDDITGGKSLTKQRLNNQLNKLSKAWSDNNDALSELIVGKQDINDIKSDVVQMKINDVINYGEEGFSHGFIQGRKAGEKRGAQEEQEFQKAVQEYNRISHKIRMGEKISEAEREKYLSGFSKGFVKGRTEGTLTERKRQASVRMYAKYVKNAKQEIQKMADGLKYIKEHTEGLPLEYKEQLDKALDNFSFDKLSAKKLWKRENLLDFLKRANINGDVIKVPEDVIDTATQIPLNEMTVEQLRDMSNLFGNIYRIGKLKDKLIDAKELRDLNIVVKESVNLITKGKGAQFVSNFIEQQLERDKNIVKLVAEGKIKSIKNYGISNLIPELQVNFLDGIDHTGVATKTLVDPIFKGNNDKNDALDIAAKKLNDIFGYRTPKEWQQFIQVADKKMKLSEMMITYAYAANDASREYLHGFGMNDEDILDVEKSLPEEDKMAVRKLWQYFDEKFPELYELRYRLEGIVTKKEDNYLGILNTENMPSDDELTWESNIRHDYSNSKSIDKGMLKSRTGKKGAFKKLDFFGTIWKTVERQEHYLAFARPVRNANKFLSHPDIENSIRTHFGDHYYNTLKKWVGDVAKGKLQYENDYFSQLSRKSRMTFTPFVLGLNISAAAKQWTGFLVGMNMAGKSATMKILPKMILNYGKISKQIQSESSLMRHSAMRQERELEEMYSERGFFEKSGHLTAYHKFQKGIMWPIQQSDLFIRNTIYEGTKQALKDKWLKDGKALNNKEIIAEAERVVRRTQPVGGLVFLPDIFRGGEGAKQLTFLKGHPNKFFNRQIEMIAKGINGKLRVSQMIASLLFDNMFPLLLMGAIEQKKLDDAWQWTTAEGAQLFSGVALVQDIFNSLRDGRWEINFPLQQYLSIFGKVITAPWKAKRGGKDKITRAVEAAGAATGVPVTEAEKLFSGKPFGEGKPKMQTRQSNNTVDLL